MTYFRKWPITRKIRWTENIAEIVNISEDLLDSLQNCFAAVPGARIHGMSQAGEIGGPIKPSAIINTRIRNSELAIVAETRADVYPRDAREAVWQLKLHQKALESSDRHYVPMIIARSVSAGARAFLQEEHVAYHDLSGSLYINEGDVFVLIEKPKAKQANRRETRIFKGSRAQVLHALFFRRNEWVAGVSQTFKELERRDWLDVKGEGPAKRRRLVQADALLDAWRDSIISAPKAKREGYYVPRMKPEDIARQIRREAPPAKIDLEFTAQFAAQSYAPFLSSVSSLTVRVPGKRRRELLISMLGARKASRGANLVLIDAGSNKLRLGRGEGEEQLLATPLQVYLDLFEDFGRSKEMAEHLRSRKLT